MAFNKVVYFEGSKKLQQSLMKNEDYRRSLVDEIDKLHRNGYVISQGSPRWAADLHRESSNQGQSPIFLYKYLYPHKYTSIRTNRPSSAVGYKDYNKEYKPNTTHQYLSSTHLRDQSINEVNLKYGRPTRTTLLRAQQRKNFKPVNSYEERRKVAKKQEELLANCSRLSVKEHDSKKNEESSYSFLTGARYTGAHCLDSRSLDIYGVYMPRHDPDKYFVTGNKLGDRIKTCPSAPPDSPRSPTPLLRNRPKTAPSFRRQIKTTPRQAWNSDAPEQVTDLNLQDSTKVSLTNEVDQATTSKPEILPTIKGISVSKSGRSPGKDTTTPGRQSPPPSPSSAAADIHVAEEGQERSSTGHAPWRHEGDTDRCSSADLILTTDQSSEDRLSNKLCDESLIDEISPSETRINDTDSARISVGSAPVITIPSDTERGATLINDK